MHPHDNVATSYRLINYESSDEYHYKIKHMKSCLSIQSHVCHGYVGGKAAVFPLQTQGWEVDYINTVNFSNHTGYGSFRGEAIEEQELTPVLNQLNRLHLNYNAIITGYIPNADLIRSIGEYIQAFKKNTSSKLIYLLDPVMGDNNYLYVDKKCVSEYRDVLSHEIVDIVTPNQFELELLTESKINGPESLMVAIQLMHTKYKVPFVVITSLDGSLLAHDSSSIYCAISTISSPEVRLFKIPIIKSYFTGVGDLFSALLLDKLTKNIGDQVSPLDSLSRSISQVLTIMSRTLRMTHKLALKLYNKNVPSGKDLEGKINDGDTMKYFELRIIQARQFYDYDGEGEFEPMVLK